MSSNLTGSALLEDPKQNRGTAFTQQEREEKVLTGLLPPVVETLEGQVKRCLFQLSKKSNDLEQYIYLSQLADTNRTLFYAVLATDPARFLKIVYDPIMGAACLEFGHIYRRPNGMYVSMDQRGRLKDVLKNWPVNDVRVICVSTGGRILGLGDLGANGVAFRLASCSCIPPAPVSIRRFCFQSCWTAAPTMSSFSAIRSTWNFGRNGHRPTSWTSSCRSLWMRCRTIFQSAAFTSRTGKAQTPSDC